MPNFPLGPGPSGALLSLDVEPGPLAAATLVAVACAGWRFQGKPWAQGAAIVSGGLVGVLLPRAAAHPWLAAGAVLLAFLAAPRIGERYFPRVLYGAHERRVEIDVMRLALSVWALGCVASF